MKQPSFRFGRIGFAGVIGAGALSGLAALAACGGGDDSTGPGSGDSGRPDGTVTTTPPLDGGTHTGGDTGTSPGDSSPPPTPVTLDGGATAPTVYAGTSATLDASAMGGTGTIAFSWTLNSVPSGSAVTTASIVNATSGVATVPTDKPGAYLLTVTATAGTNTATASVTLTAVVGNVVYARGDSDASGNVGSVWTVGADGTNPHAVTCPVKLPSFAFGGGTAATGAVADIDTWEGAPGSPNHVVFALPSTADAGVYTGQLYAIDTSASCGDAGADAGDAGGGTGATPIATVQGSSEIQPVHPRISPDGTKVAFLGFDESNVVPGTYLATVGIDGTGYAQNAFAYSDGGTANDNVFTAGYHQVEWVDETHLGWTQEDKETDGGLFTHFVTASVPPAAGDPQLFMTCPGVSAKTNRALFLADGTVLTTLQPSTTVPADLVVLKPAAPGGACSVVHNLSNLRGQGTNYVTAFALSPDGTTVAYLGWDSVNDGDAGERDVLYTVPLAGSAAPTRTGLLATQATDVRWAQGGTQIVFTHSEQTATNGSATSAGSVAAYNFAAAAASDGGSDAGDGGSSLDIVTGSGTVTTTAVGSGDGGCSLGGASSPLATMLAGALGALGLVLRRRSRRERRPRP